MKYRKHDPASKARRAELSRNSYYKKREEKLAVMQAYRKTANGKARRAHHHNKRKGAPFTKSALEYVPILLADPCSYCGNPAEVIDHIQPIALDGDSDSNNLTAACRACNSRKYAKPLLHFLLWR
jgi:5-methylcytosine-specific restriction endonuclease McrA